jgi:hypothetical protein
MSMDLKMLCYNTSDNSLDEKVIISCREDISKVLEVLELFNSDDEILSGDGLDNVRRSLSNGYFIEEYIKEPLLNNKYNYYYFLFV